MAIGNEHLNTSFAERPSVAAVATVTAGLKIKYLSSVLEVLSSKDIGQGRHTSGNMSGNFL